jgi:cob(I)alamin adenosyltransferase
MVVLNKIYTRAGDGGKTRLSTGEPRLKCDPRVEAYGAVDEANACVGLARQHTAAAHAEIDAMLGRIQNDLFDLGADLATPDTGKPLKWEPLRIVEAQVERLEQEIDALNANLQPLNSFILPGGSVAAAALRAAPSG